MLTVHKYALQLVAEQAVNLPRGADLLDVQLQAGALTLWARVESEAPLRPRTIHLCGTGHPAPSGAPHIATVQTGDFVWHLFDGGPA